VGLEIKVRPRLAELLKEKGLTQLKLSEKSGVPQGAISRFDRSVQHKDEILFRIAHALGVSIQDLFEVEIKEKPDADQ
jgi:transcriptional regulator with XRE-family HTH domain